LGSLISAEVMLGVNAGRKRVEVDADCEKAAVYAAMLAPYRHARLFGSRGVQMVVGQCCDDARPVGAKGGGTYNSVMEPKRLAPENGRAALMKS
jgi:hypothetical protein